jgi:hypothetical protein
MRSTVRVALWVAMVGAMGAGVARAGPGSTGSPLMKFKLEETKLKFVQQEAEVIEPRSVDRSPVAPNDPVPLPDDPLPITIRNGGETCQLTCNPTCTNTCSSHNTCKGYASCPGTATCFPAVTCWGATCDGETETCTYTCDPYITCGDPTCFPQRTCGHQQTCWVSCIPPCIQPLKAEGSQHSTHQHGHRAPSLAAVGLGLLAVLVVRPRRQQRR